MGKYVLVSEDDNDILNLVCAVLEDEGYEVQSTVGANTLQSVKERRPDVILLDYHMPGMDGVSVAQQLRNDPRTSAIPIVAMTAAGRAPTICHMMDADGCLGKPFDIDHLVEIVDSVSHTTH